MPQVKGQRIDVNSKIRTRARAKQQAEQWQMVPLPAKLIAMLADSVSESQQSQKAAGKQPISRVCVTPVLLAHDFLGECPSQQFISLEIVHSKLYQDRM